MKSPILLLLLALGLLTSCSTQPEPINYGTDVCHFCKMTIVSKTHAAQAVSNKGKQFKYDAIECMVNDLNMENKAEMSILLVANYLNAGEMLPAEKATYIITPNIPSPMGGNLSATANNADAEKLKAENGGELFDWNALKNRKVQPNHGHH
ncbi:MAG TPA: nitrous oxide reductase accessory protein NosL [Flavobacteriaceae bacterium]|nr:nitrous oxide reductase accessory protein NosL [Flavobacteriaceae bacterium]